MIAHSLLKKLHLIAILLLSCIKLLAGVDPCAPTPIANDMIEFETFTNIGFGNSPVPDPGCGIYSGPDVWFEITVPASGKLLIVLQALVMDDAGAALYNGDCANPDLITCIESDFCGSDMPIIEIEDLVPGSTVWLRIWAENTASNGDFELLVNDGSLESPEFNTFGTANYINDNCIQLTASVPGQSGCAWFPEFTDFSVPFSHTFNFNFGFSDAGADGMCLIYQTSGPSECGATGGSIAAEGILNSFIVEFDTYQNSAPPYNDPFSDHASVNINGDMDHNNSIDGPVTLGSGNVENGTDYEVTFNWDPVTMTYEVWFDGALILGGVFDIITNCFGGDPLAYWGFSGSTGALTNQQVVCFEGLNFDHGYKTIFEEEICFGEFYFAGGFFQSQSGIYYDEIPLSNGCYELVETHLEVHPTYEDDREETVCFGECVEINGTMYCDDGDYEINIGTVHTNCDSTINLSLTVLDVFAFVETPEPITCFTQSVFLDPSNSLPDPGPNVVYTWTGPAGFTSTETSPEVSNPGLYTLVISYEEDGVLCISDPFDVELDLDEDIPDAEAGPDLFLDCSTNMVTPNTFGTSTNGNYSYLWEGPNGFNSTSLDISLTEEGIYTLTVFDEDNGCFSFDELEVILDGSALAINIPIDTINCLTDSLILVVNSNGNLDSYNWSGPSGFVSDSASPTIFLGGEYFVTVTDINGCEGTASQTIIADTNVPNAFATTDTLSCINNSVILAGSSDSSNVSFLWSGPNGFSLDSQYAEINIPGIYTLHVASENGCFTTFDIEVFSDGELPIIGAIQDTSFTCALTNINLAGTSNFAGSTFNWVGPNGFTSDNPDPNVDTAGTYQLTVISPNGCESSLEVVIDEDFTLPSATINFDSLDCSQLISDVEVIPTSDDYQYSWTGPNSFTSSMQNIQTNDAGNYQLVLLGLNACSDTFYIDIPIDTLSPNVSLSADTLSCDLDSIQIVLQNGSPDYAYSWSGPNGFLSNLASPFVQQGGSFQTEIIAENGCSQNTSIFIEVDDDIPFLELTADTITCAGIDFNISIFNADDGLTYQWSGPNGFNSTLANPQIIEAGQYAVLATAGNGCEQSYPITVIDDLAAPDISILPDTLDCSTNQINLSILGHDPSYSYTWSGPQGFVSNESNPQVSLPGFYTLIVQSNNFCQDTATNEIVQNDDVPQIIDILTIDESCGGANGAIQGITVLGGNQPFQYSLDSINFQQDDIFSNLDAGEYTITLLDDTGCSTSFPFEILASSNPEINLTPSILLNLGENYQLNPMLNIDSSLLDTLYWSPSIGLDCPTCLYPSITALDNQTYQINIIDIYGCSSSASILIQVNHSFEVFIPNTFTPNRDGKNDRFTIYGDPNLVEEVEQMSIFDRWGERVWSGEHFDIGNDKIGWDGSFKGRTLNPGVFIYHCTIRLKSGEVIQYAGDITLIY